MWLLRQLLITVAIITLVVVILFARVREGGVELRVPITYSGGACNDYIFIEWTTQGFRSSRDHRCI